MQGRSRKAGSVGMPMWRVDGGTGGMKIEIRPVDSLKEYGNNARAITEAEVAYIARCISEVGFIAPVVIEADGTIVCGHAATRAAREAGLSEVPCVIADGLSDEQVRAFRLADNKTATMAIWNTEKLTAEFAKLTDERFGLEGLGFDPRMFGLAAGKDGESDGGTASDTSREVDLDAEYSDEEFEYECPHCGLKFNA